jgi:DNA end-binding protein Ku
MLRRNALDKHRTKSTDAGNSVLKRTAAFRTKPLRISALPQFNLVAVAQFTMHGRQHIVIVRSGAKGLLAHTMFFSPEVRADEGHTAETDTITQKELDLAQTLIHSLAAPLEPQKYRDTYREKLESIIASRVGGQPTAVSENAG